MKTISARDAEMPALGLGTWQLQGRLCADRVSDALALGYRHVDTAQMYENHEQVGAGIRASGVPRSELFLTTKLWRDQLRRDAVFAGTERSLRELGTDYVDLLLVHWPNEDVPLEETFEAMLDLREQGKLRHVGVSNFPRSHLDEAIRTAPIVCDQVEYHPLLSQEHLLEPLRAHGMALVAYSPFAHGEVLEHPMLREVGHGHDRTPAQVALAWLLGQPQVAAIPKASSREHLEDNLGALDFVLSAEERRRIDALARKAGERTVDPDFAPTWER